MNDGIVQFPGTKTTKANININPEDIVCQKCGHDIFEQKLKLKKVSRIQSPTGQEMIVPVPVVICDKCKCELSDDESSKEDTPSITL